LHGGTVRQAKNYTVLEFAQFEHHLASGSISNSDEKFATAQN